MRDQADIDRLLSQAATHERARNVDPEFVAKVERLLGEQNEWSWLDALPGLALVCAAVVALPVLLSDWVGVSGALHWWTEPVGLQMFLDSLAAVINGPTSGWSVGSVLFVLLFSWWVPNSDV